jgi:prepilin-type processing-associated H-X9-DG protein
VSGLYAGICAGTLISVVVAFIQIPSFTSGPNVIDGFSQIAVVTCYSFVFCFIAGMPQGVIAGLCGTTKSWCWVWGGVVTGLTLEILSVFFVGDPTGVGLPLLVLLIVSGSILCANLNSNTTWQLPARWLATQISCSPLEEWPAWKRTLSSFATPLMFILIVLAALTWPTFWQHRSYISRIGLWRTWSLSLSFSSSQPHYSRRAYCRSNLKQIMLGIKQYEQDYNDRLPTVASGGQYSGWADALQPYLKSTQIYQCPQDFMPGQDDPKKLDYTDYWFNTNLSAMNESKINSSATTICLGEGNDGNDLTNAQYNYSALPKSWQTSDSPILRHLFGGNYAFVDGHVKWLYPNKVSTSSSPNGPTSSPQ